MIGILNYDNERDRAEVINLWETVFAYTGARNNPELALNKKLEAGDELLFVARNESDLVGTVMAGYDGHRGWIYSLAVSREHRENRTGTTLLNYAEKELERRGCLKINLQVLPSNKGVIHFYEKNGYTQEERISMGKVIQNNIPGEIHE